MQVERTPDPIETQISKKGGNPMFENFDALPTVLNVKELQAFLGISQSSTYDLMHRADFPTLHIASRLLVAKDKLLVWMEQNTDTVSNMQ